MSATPIQWTDHSINPIRARIGSSVGHYCEKLSPGCKNCYSSALQPRFRMPMFQEQRRADVEIFLDESKLEEVLRRRTPTKYFWCDMTDMFGDWVPNEMIAKCFGVMAATPQHTHQILTKRADRARRWFQWIDQVSAGLPALVGATPPAGASVQASYCAMEAGSDVLGAGDSNRGSIRLGRTCDTTPWPLPNVWLGVSCEDQKRADERIPHLLETPAAIRFVSAEPLLGPIDLSGEYLRAKLGEYPFPKLERTRFIDLLDWIIVGGESGSKARPCALEWIERIVDDCEAAQTPVFVKQLGRVVVSEERTFELEAMKEIRGPEWKPEPEHIAPDGSVWAWRAGLHDSKGGDPREWPSELNVRQFPEARR